MADLGKVIKLTASQYSTLASGGTVGSYTGLNSSYLYLVENSVHYIPLGGTTSLYGSIVPSADKSVDLGSTTRRILDIYASSVNVASRVSIFSSAYMSYASISNVWTENIYWPGDMYIAANGTVVGGGNTGTLSINAGSDIEINAYTSTYLMAKNGVNYIYGNEGVKIRAGNIDNPYSVYAYSPPYISMTLSGGYYPSIYMSANFSGNGYIGMYAANIQLMGDYIEASPSGYSKGNFTCHFVPVTNGYLHNIFASCKIAGSGGHWTAFVVQLYLPTSTPLTGSAAVKGPELWQALWDQGYSGMYSSFEVAISAIGLSRFLPVVSATTTYAYTANGPIIGICALSRDTGDGKAFGYVRMNQDWYTGKTRTNNDDCSPYYFDIEDNVRTIQI